MTGVTLHEVVSPEKLTCRGALQAGQDLFSMSLVKGSREVLGVWAFVHGQGAPVHIVHRNVEAENDLDWCPPGGPGSLFNVGWWQQSCFKRGERGECTGPMAPMSSQWRQLLPSPQGEIQ